MASVFSHREINDTSGAMETWYWDEDAQKFEIRTTHKIGDVLQRNQAQANSNLNGRYGKEMIHHVAEIPNGVVIKLKREYDIDVFSSDPEQQKKLKRILDDPEFRYLKSTTKKLSRVTP